MIKKYLSVFVLALLTPALLVSKSMSSPESRMVRSVAEGIRLYQTHIEDIPVESWNQLAKLDLNLHALNSYLKDQNISELYSFVPVEDRSKFPDGDLILIRYEPMPYPEILKDEYDPDDPRKERNESFYKPVRYLVYRDSSGELKGTRWYEEDIQKMLAETGIRVPEPELYRPPAVAEIPSDPPAPDVEVVAQEPTAPEPATEKPDEVKTPDTTEEPAEQSSNWWLWLIGLLVVVGGLAVVVRRKG